MSSNRSLVRGCGLLFSFVEDVFTDGRVDAGSGDADGVGCSAVLASSAPRTSWSMYILCPSTMILSVGVFFGGVCLLKFSRH